jgi:hypothetical protein
MDADFEGNIREERQISVTDFNGTVCASSWTE